MSRLRVAPIVEGHGEKNSIRILIQRIWDEILGGAYVEVLQPIRWSRGKLMQSAELGRAIDLAALKLRAGARETEHNEPGMVLILVDADSDPPCILGPELLREAQGHRADMDVACVVAQVEYETWFIAAATSLGDYLDLAGEAMPADPEGQRLGKGWIQKRFRGVKYSETVDQPAMTSRMDLHQCRQKSASFDKLCRELESRFSPLPEV